LGLALTDYRAALEYLFARVSGGWKLGLDTTRALLSTLNDPQRRFPAFHVAGTNGKGSVVFTLDALLRARGLRVGRYTSPHLVDFRERIVVDGQPISEQDVTQFITAWTPEVERLGATFFEATTAMAFDHFARQQVDVGVIEVGLGGRLDSTNVITPISSGIVSIGMDHMQYLGDSLELIATEKAGICKPNVPVVIGELDPKIRGLLRELATRAGARPVRLLAEENGGAVTDVEVRSDGTRFTLHHDGRTRQLHTPLVGRFQAMNAAVAIAMLEAAGGVYREAARSAEETLGQVSIPGRFQRCGNVIFDVAHNPVGTAVLCETLATVAPPRPVVCLLTVLRDKDWRSMMATLAKHVDRIVLSAPPSVPADRAWALDDAVAYAAEQGWPVEAESDFGHALARARAGAATLLVTGSFHTVGDAMLRLQVSPLAA